MALMKTMHLALVALSLALLTNGPVSGGQPQHFPQEVPWTGKPALSNQPIHAGLTWRGWIQATVFPEFVFSGTFEGAIEHLMVESRKFSPDGRTVGGFVVRGGVTTMRINVKLRGRNVLEIVDALCALSKANWTLSPYSIIIQHSSNDNSK